MMEYWKVEGIYHVTEQRLVDQARQIKTNQWLSDIEIEDLKRSIQSSLDR